MCSRHVSTKERRRAFPFAAGNTDIRPLSRPGKTQRTCATRARIDEAKTARRSAFSPPLFSRSIHHCAFSNAYSQTCIRVKIGNFFFRFFANLIFLRNLIISKHENLDIWNGRLGKFWKMNGRLCIWNMNWNFVLLSWAQFEKCITLFSRVQYAIEVSKTWICKKLRII